MAIIMIILVSLAILKGATLVKNKYKWYDNLELFIRSFKVFFYYQIFLWVGLFMSLFWLELYTILPEDFFSTKVLIFKDIGQGLMIMNMIFVFSIFIFLSYLILKPDKRIQEIKNKYAREVRK